MALSSGAEIEAWSRSNNVWCPGIVEKTEGTMVYVNFRSPAGEIFRKGIPSGHPDLRLRGGIPLPQQPASAFLSPQTGEVPSSGTFSTQPSLAPSPSYTPSYVPGASHTASARQLPSHAGSFGGVNPGPSRWNAGGAENSMPPSVLNLDAGPASSLRLGLQFGPSGQMQRMPSYPGNVGASLRAPIAPIHGSGASLWAGVPNGPLAQAAQSQMQLTEVPTLQRQAPGTDIQRAFEIGSGAQINAQSFNSVVDSVVDALERYAAVSQSAVTAYEASAPKWQAKVEPGFEREAAASHIAAANSIVDALQRHAATLGDTGTGPAEPTGLPLPRPAKILGTKVLNLGPPVQKSETQERNPGGLDVGGPLTDMSVQGEFQKQRSPGGLDVGGPLTDMSVQSEFQKQRSPGAGRVKLAAYESTEAEILQQGLKVAEVSGIIKPPAEAPGPSPISSALPDITSWFKFGEDTGEVKTLSEVSDPPNDASDLWCKIEEDAGSPRPVIMTDLPEAEVEVCQPGPEPEPVPGTPPRRPGTPPRKVSSEGPERSPQSEDRGRKIKVGRICFADDDRLHPGDGVEFFFEGAWLRGTLRSNDGESVSVTLDVDKQTGLITKGPVGLMRPISSGQGDTGGPPTPVPQPTEPQTKMLALGDRVELCYNGEWLPGVLNAIVDNMVWVKCDVDADNDDVTKAPIHLIRCA